MTVDCTEIKEYSGEQDRKYFCSHRADDLKTLAKKYTQLLQNLLAQ